MGRGVTTTLSTAAGLAATGCAPSSSTRTRGIISAATVSSTPSISTGRISREVAVVDGTIPESDSTESELDNYVSISISELRGSEENRGALEISADEAEPNGARFTCPQLPAR